MKISTLRITVGWIFLVGHFLSIGILFWWALFWSSQGFAAISDIVALLMPLTGVAAVSGFKTFWMPERTKASVSRSAAIATIALPLLLSAVVLSLVVAQICQLASSPETVKQGIALCELIFGGLMTFILDKLFHVRKEEPKKARSERLSQR